MTLVRGRGSFLLLLLLLLTTMLDATANAQRQNKHSAPKGRAQKRLALTQAIDRILKSDPSFARAHVGIQVVEAASGRILYARNDQQLFVPASNTKLLTTTAGFDILGPQWKTRTSVESAQAIDSKGDLDADLVLVGRGDANLSGRVLPYNGRTERTTPPLKPLEALADRLIAGGLKHVRGAVIGDDSWFAHERWGDSWGQDDLMWEFAAPVSALAVNDDVMYFTITPAATAGGQATVSAMPFTAVYTIDNRVVTSAPGTEKHLAMDRQPGTTIIHVWGQIPAGTAADNYALSMDDPALFAADSLRTMLQARGVKVDGEARSQHGELFSLPADLPQRFDNTVPVRSLANPAADGRVELATIESHPLGEDLKVINKVSQNLHVEILMRQLGRAASPFPNTTTGGSIWGGTNVVRRFLVNKVGISPEEFEYNDGSGMTPHNLVTPAMLVKLLLWARNQPWAPEFVDTLPIAGVDGSLAHRFVGTPVAGRVHAKTGTLTQVSALSGYATRLDGREIVFSILVNDEKIEKVNARLVDPIVRAMVEAPTR